MKNVIALVVTHNRHQSLVNCIEAIRSQSLQPDQILVINNGSSDYTSVWLDQQDDVIHIYQDNMGPSGGFYSGIAWSHQHQYNWVWCMEDDSYPHPTALEMLLNGNTENETSLLSSLIMNTSNQHKETINPFNGSLIHHSIISKSGLPKPNLFSNGAETEYYYRITKKHGFSAKIISESIHYHSSSLADYQNQWNISSSVSLYFVIRNQYEVNKSKCSNNFLAFLQYLNFIYKLLISISLKQKKQKWSKSVFVLQAMTDGLTGNFNETALSVQQRLKRRYSNSGIENFVYPIRNFVLTTFVPSFSEIQKTS